jgi:hypothetical protein
MPDHENEMAKRPAHGQEVKEFVVAEDTRVDDWPFYQVRNAADCVR